MQLCRATWQIRSYSTIGQNGTKTYLCHTLGRASCGLGNYPDDTLEHQETLREKYALAFGTNPRDQMLVSQRNGRSELQVQHPAIGLNFLR